MTWQAVVTYMSPRASQILNIESLSELDNLINRGPDKIEIDRITLTTTTRDAVKASQAFWGRTEQ